MRYAKTEVQICKTSLADRTTQPIAKNAVIMLVNLSDDPEVLDSLASDDGFLELLLLRITVC
jgi:hypothetical protein